MPLPTQIHTSNLARKLPSSSINASNSKRNVLPSDKSKKVPDHCIVVPFKTRILAPGELARPSKGNLILETQSNIWTSVQQNFKLQLQHTPVQQRKTNE
jgi:hypothetical protein